MQEYISGYFDGKGIIILEEKRNKSGSISYRIRIQIQFKTKDLIEHIVQTLGYGTIYQAKTKYVLCINNQEEVLQFLYYVRNWILDNEEKVHLTIKMLEYTTRWGSKLDTKAYTPELRYTLHETMLRIKKL